MPPREAYDTPEREKEYPEPAMFGLLPAYGFYIRHARGVVLHDVDVSFAKEDTRPAFFVEDVNGIEFEHVRAKKSGAVPTFVLKKVEGFSVRQSSPVADTKVEKTVWKEF